MVRADIADLNRGGVKPTAGDIRCVGFGHIIRLAVWFLRPSWKRDAPVGDRLAAVGQWIEEQLGGISVVLDALGDDFLKAPSRQPTFIREGRGDYGNDEESIPF